jgi:hypothetical protein
MLYILEQHLLLQLYNNENEHDSERKTGPRFRGRLCRNARVQPEHSRLLKATEQKVK